MIPGESYDGIELVNARRSPRSSRYCQIQWKTNNLNNNNNLNSKATQNGAYSRDFTRVLVGVPNVIRFSVYGPSFCRHVLPAVSVHIRRVNTWPLRGFFGVLELISFKAHGNHALTTIRSGRLNKTWNVRSRTDNSVEGCVSDRRKIFWCRQRSGRYSGIRLNCLKNLNIYFFSIHIIRYLIKLSLSIIFFVQRKYHGSVIRVTINLCRFKSP